MYKCVNGNFLCIFFLTLFFLISGEIAMIQLYLYLPKNGQSFYFLGEYLHRFRICKILFQTYGNTGVHSYRDSRRAGQRRVFSGRILGNFSKDF